MYFKLAFRNVKKSYKDYFIYFITLMFSVSLFYIFNSFERQSDILKMSQNQGMMVQALVEVMRVMSYFVAFVFGFLILYANNFLIKRRKKELGLYTLLGMQKTKISLLLILETVMVGVVSLFAGLVLGFVGSQATALLTAKLLAVSVNYAFVFSVGGALKTVLIFSLVFVVVIAFNRFILERYQLIDLIRAERQNEHSKVLNFGVSLVLFVLGVAVLITTYGYAMQPLMLPRHLPWIILSGVVATFMIFKALSGFIVTLIQSQKRIYYRK